MSISISAAVHQRIKVRSFVEREGAEEFAAAMRERLGGEFEIETLGSEGAYGVDVVAGDELQGIGRVEFLERLVFRLV